MFFLSQKIEFLIVVRALDFRFEFFASLSLCAKLYLPRLSWVPLYLSSAVSKIINFRNAGQFLTTIQLDPTVVCQVLSNICILVLVECPYFLVLNTERHIL